MYESNTDIAPFKRVRYKMTWTLDVVPSLKFSAVYLHLIYSDDLQHCGEAKTYYFILTRGSILISGERNIDCHFLPDRDESFFLYGGF